MAATIIVAAIFNMYFFLVYPDGDDLLVSILSF